MLTPLDSFPLSPEPPVRSSPLVTPPAGGERPVSWVANHEALPEPISIPRGFFRALLIAAAFWTLILGALAVLPS